MKKTKRKASFYAPLSPPSPSDFSLTEGVTLANCIRFASNKHWWIPHSLPPSRNGRVGDSSSE